MTETDGYAIHPSVFSPAEMGDLLRTLDDTPLDRTRAGARHVLGVPAIREVAHDSRLLHLARAAVGAGAVPFRATLFDKSPDANWLVVWHQDTALPIRHRIEALDWGPWSTKAGVLYAHAPAWALNQVVALRVNLDESTSANGPLRVLPGTHRLGVLADARIEALVREIAAVECTTTQGGVVEMRPLIVHASSKSQDDRPRRVLHLEYAASAHLGPDVELATA